MVFGQFLKFNALTISANLMKFIGSPWFIAPNILNIYVFLAFILTLISHSSAEASINLETTPPSILELDRNANTDHLGYYLQVFEDNEGRHTIEQVTSMDSNKWKKTSSSTPNYGMTETTYWFKLISKNTSKSTLNLLLSIEYPPLDDIQVHMSNNMNQLVKVQLGDIFPFYSRPIANKHYAIPVFYEPLETKTIYFRVRTDGSFQFPINIRSNNNFSEINQRTNLGLGAYLGIMLAMALYNFILYLAIKEKVYLYFSFLMLSYGIFQAALTGIGFQYLWPTFIELNAFIFPLSMSLGFYSACLFMLEFLQVKKHSLIHYRMLRVCMYLAMISFILSLIIPYHLSVRIAVALGLPTSAFGVYISASILLKGYKYARYFLIAWIGFIVFSILLSLNKFGVLPRTPLTEHGVQFGNVLSVLLMSLALAEGININKRELHNAEQEALSLEKQARIERERYLKLELETKEEEIKNKEKIYKAQLESKAKSDFMAVMSHEIRTPMNGVLGMTEILKETTLNPQQRNYVNVIENSGRSLLAIINDILDYSKIEANKMTVEKVAFNLSELCEECTNSFILLAENKNIKLTYSISNTTPNYIFSDPSRLRQVLSNLIGNALKFTKQGKIELLVEDIEAQYQSGTGHLLQFKITDSGIGISEEEQESLFKRFSQADTSTTREYGGTGLGLIICQQLSQLMGGSIEVKSKKGEGSTFTFYIRAKKSSQLFVEKRTLLEQQEQDTLQLKGKTILIAEDNPINQIVINKMLEKLEVEQMLVEDGEQAINTIKNKHAEIDLVLMDCEMPKVDGYRACMNIRDWERESNIVNIPIIAVTAHALKEHRQKSQDAGMNAHLSKPISLKDLKKVLLQYLT